MADLGPSDYTWLGLTSPIAQASCFSFFDGLSVEDTAERTGIQEWRAEGPRASRDLSLSLTHGEVAVLSESGWTIMYEPTGYPDRFANKIAENPDVARCVVVFWNVNAVTEFAYWERGIQIVSFDWPQDRVGADPDRLLAEMRETTGLERTGVEGGTVFDIFQQMLALAERVTGVRLGEDFLGGHSVVIGDVDEDDEESEADSSGEDDGRESSLMDMHAGPTQSKWVEPGTGGRPEWVPDERRANEQALAGIPKERWAEIPARLARLACERVRIADDFPVEEILDDLDHGRRPHPARMTIPWDIYAQVEHVTMGWNAVPTERVWAAIEAVFAAAKAKSRRSPFEVLLQARVAAGDHGTRVVDELRAQMDLS